MTAQIKTTITALALILLPFRSYAQDPTPATPPPPSATELISSYRFGEAANALRSQIRAAREAGNPTGRLEKDLRTATLGESMLRATERVTMVDSVSCSRDALFSLLRLSEECGRVAPAAAFTDLGFSIDGATVFQNALQNTLLFARKDAAGKKKLFSSNRLANNTWTTPEPIALSSSEDATQDYPYLCADGRTLYFAAQGTESLGGYDIFVTRYDTETRSYLRPENVGMPFNSPDNDYLMLIDDASGLGWFVTDRRQPASKVCVYCFVPNESREVFGENTNSAALRRAARLLRMADFQTDKPALTAARERLDALRSNKGRAAKAADFIVVSNDLVYGSPAAFRNETARRIAQQWSESKTQLQTDCDTLDKLRAQYATANAAERATLKDEILRLERQTLDTERSMQTMEKDMRAAELGK